jgi:acetyl-CoA carboxylase biotin carboxylase subunit
MKMAENIPADAKIFIANRGEIAYRIVCAAKAMGIETVLGVSSIDQDSLGAKTADQVLVLGPPQAKDSYLKAELLVHAAKASGCHALHPGYGFLSERASLARLCEEEGIIFVGPRPETIERVGDKLSARELAKSANIPLTSGSDKVDDLAAALKIADEIGYPVITKASAGGGGHGMIVARSEVDLKKSFEQASTTALEAFGDGTMYLERFVEKARHIEVQLVGDGKGGVLHFAERDCSLQRRYQKMVEESPAPILPSKVRNRLHKAATDLLASIEYRNAGTVEFLYDEEREEFYFMEVNARIQVEHPVSEEITGFDLIKTQLSLAFSDELAIKQEDIVPNGHAIEVRIIAEDPDQDFAPSPGRITKWIPPTGEGVRLDSALEEGALVPPYYDSMIAKLIVHGKDRPEAIKRLQGALATFEIEGITTNIPFLKAIVDHPDFHSNTFDTRWLEKTLMPAFNTTAV